MWVAQVCSRRGIEAFSSKTSFLDIARKNLFVILSRNERYRRWKEDIEPVRSDIFTLLP